MSRHKEHRTTIRQAEGGEHRATCRCGWEGDFWFTKKTAEDEAFNHRAAARLADAEDEEPVTA